MTFQLVSEAERPEIIDALASLVVDETTVVGIGLPVVARLGAQLPRLRVAPHLVGPGVEMPSTPGALWVWLCGDDRGELLHTGRAIEELLAPAFEVIEVVDGFRYGKGRDLTGYEDGTENPTGEAATAVAFVEGDGPGQDGSSFVAVQTWLHDLDEFDGHPLAERDAMIGRRIRDNTEIADAPASAHVKRTEQEGFSPEAFVLRRSMPWCSADGEGLVFVAFGASFDAFEAQCRRMVGLDDGIVDALFRFTRPVSGAYFWCPPVIDTSLDLSSITPSE